MRNSQNEHKQQKKAAGGFRESVKGRIQLAMTSVTVVSLTILGVVCLIMNYVSTMETLEQVLRETAELTAERVEWEIERYKTLVYEMGSMPTLANENVSFEEKKAVLDSKLGQYDLSECNVIGADGINLLNEVDCSEREYFKEAMAGNIYISEPAVSKVSGKMTIFLSAPLWKDGMAGSEIVGAIMIIPNEEFLNQIMKSIQISENCGAYMIAQNGNTIADTTMETVEAGQNIEAEAQEDHSLKDLAAIHVKMRQGEVGFGSYRIGGINKLIAYAPLSGTNGWSVGITAYKRDFTGSTMAGMIVTVILMAASIIIGMVIAKRVGEGIGNPIRIYARRLQMLSEGDLETNVEETQLQDETGVLARSTAVLVERIGGMIRDMDYLLREMAGGNFAVRTKAEEVYVGGFHGMLSSIQLLKKQLNETLRGIQETSLQVEMGAGQMAESAQALAEGATEQAGAVEELQATITNIAEGIAHNTESTKEAHTLSGNVSIGADHSSMEMQKMTEAMKRIDEASNEIAKIVTNIEEIASQTNLLSLNASIEAARAGEAGRGFAVVADEIRKLAEDSASSAATTRQLIQNALDNVQAGNEIAVVTAESLVKVVEGVGEIQSKVKGVTEISENQLEAVRQIEQGIDQISSVVQSNSAGAEENSATSEELAAQAAALKEMVQKFKLEK